MVFKPHWTKHAKAPPFKRNEHLWQSRPIGEILFPGSGITANLADKARILASRSGASMEARVGGG